MAQSSTNILVLVRDLMMASRITATAKSLDVAHQLLRDPAALHAAQGQRLIVDLNQPGALEAAAAWKQAANSEQIREVIGFVSHVDKQTIHRARAAGIEQILPRSQFVQLLPELLQTN